MIICLAASVTCLSPLTRMPPGKKLEHSSKTTTTESAAVTATRRSRHNQTASRLLGFGAGGLAPHTLPQSNLLGQHPGRPARYRTTPQRLCSDSGGARASNDRQHRALRLAACPRQHWNALRANSLDTVRPYGRQERPGGVEVIVFHISG